jgi:hypothetical protein
MKKKSIKQKGIDTCVALINSSTSPRDVIAMLHILRGAILDMYEPPQFDYMPKLSSKETRKMFEFFEDLKQQGKI